MSKSVESSTSGGEPVFKTPSTTPVVGSSSAYGLQGPSTGGIGGTDNVVVIDVGNPRVNPSVVHESGDVSKNYLKK